MSAAKGSLHLIQTPEWVGNIQCKRAISVQATEVLLYLVSNQELAKQKEKQAK